MTPTKRTNAKSSSVLPPKKSRTAAEKNVVSEVRMVRESVWFTASFIWSAKVNQTLSRTILTSLTTFFSAAVLLFFGGKTLEDFAFVLFIGVITGTYSTTYIAAAIVVDWTQHVEGRLGRGKKAVAKA